MSIASVLAVSLGIIVSATPPKLDSESFARRQPAADTLVDVGGHRLHLSVWDGEGPITILFEAGGGADASSWASVPELVAARTRARVVTYDRAGLGQSDRGPLELTPVDEIHHLHAALRHLGVSGPTLVVGHSYGGVLALLHAALYPDDVVGLVLVDPMNPGFVEAVGMDWLQTTVPDVPNPTTNGEYVMHRMKRDFPGLSQQTGKVWLSLELPMDILTAGRAWWGTEDIDGAWRKSHVEMAAATAARKLVVAESSAHNIPATEPALIVDAVARLVEDVK